MGRLLSSIAELVYFYDFIIRVSSHTEAPEMKLWAFAGEQCVDFHSDCVVVSVLLLCGE